MKKVLIGIALVVLASLSVGLLVWGCGSSGGGSSSDSVFTSYTISGTVGNVSARNLDALDASTVTHIVAVGSNNEKYLATPEATTGSFSLEVVSGWPYAVGFYNVADSTVTLLGYLRQSEVDWDSLPLMDPVTDTTDLGTIEIDTSSVEAIPSIVLDDLLTEVNMDTATANLYGTVDDLMTIFTNVDVDGNGVFDFQENKGYIFYILLNTMLTGASSSGEVTAMLTDYYDDYYPVPSSYGLFLNAMEGANASSKPDLGTATTITFPTTLYSQDGEERASNTGSTESPAGDFGWRAGFYSGGSTSGNYTTPEVIPSGTYTMEVSGWGTYTFANVKGSSVVSVGTAEGIVFPVFKLATNEAGLLTTVYYKWYIREDSENREATAAEVTAMIGATSSSESSYVGDSPTVSVYVDYWGEQTAENYYPPKVIEVSSSSLDVTDWNVSFADIDAVGSGYRLNNNVEISFLFFE